MCADCSRCSEVFDGCVQVNKAVIGTLEAELRTDEWRLILVVQQLFVGVTVRVADSDQLDGCSSAETCVVIDAVHITYLPSWM
jgi:hypothetical protein